MVIVTSYNSPDIDGIACCIAYSELLNKLGKKTKTTYFGDLGLEGKFVKNYTKYFPVKEHKGKYSPEDTFILLDTADPEALEPAIPLGKVIEVFDHRKLAYPEKFPNADCHIELVGSCSTLIAEQFKKRKLIPSKNAAIYLYSAIVSNTINFKNSVTTERDIKISNWLKSLTNLPRNYIEIMFNAKSRVNASNLYKFVHQDFTIKTTAKKRVGIAQIEIVDLEKKISEWGKELEKALIKLKKEFKVDFILFTGIDVIKGFNIFVFIDPDSITLFSKALEIPNLTSGYKTKSIIMRKEIGPKVEKILI